MSKIIYGVAGEGFGHSSRSHLTGQRLIDAGHDVMFVGSQKSLLYLKQYFGSRVKEIFGLSFVFENGRVDKSETLKKNLLKLPDGNKINDELFHEHFDKFEPDLVISDFEPFSAWWAWRKKVPFISIDHQHMLTLCELEHKGKNWFSRLTAEVVTQCHYIGATAYVIINFFKAPLRMDSAILAPPVIRPVVAELNPIQGEHVLLYSTSGDERDKLLDILHKFKHQKFYIYGFNEYLESGNCILKERSTEGFLRDLAESRGVIASAGFSLLSECLYLKKKMLLLPLPGQYEQIINAHYIEKLGLGLASEKIEEEKIGLFLDELDKPFPNDERILQNAFNKLDRPISIELK